MTPRRRPLLAVALAVALGIALLAGARTARATVWLERYAVDVTIPPPGKSLATYVLTFVYRAQGETKKSGFKFVGREPIKDLWATDVQGRRLRAEVAREVSSKEYKIDFDVPEADAEGRQTVKVGFVQSITTKGYGWGYRTGEIPWAPNFRITVNTMEVTLTGPSGLEAPSDFGCSGTKPVVCSRGTKGTRAVRFDFPSSESVGAIAMMIGVLLIAGGLLALVVRSRYHKVLAERGVIPPASPVAYPMVVPGYRAPPPILVQEEPKPVLPAEERQKLTVRVIVGAAVLLAAMLAVAVAGNGRSPLPMPFMVTVVALIGAPFMWPFLATEKAKPWLPLSVAASTGGLIALGSLVGLAFAGVPLFIWLISLMPSGTGSSYGSSYSSCSSGSSCGGGGGGGGCGGGGGGGGCGG